MQAVDTLIEVPATRCLTDGCLPSPLGHAAVVQAVVKLVQAAAALIEVPATRYLTDGCLPSFLGHVAVESWGEGGGKGEGTAPTVSRKS